MNAIVLRRDATDSAVTLELETRPVPEPSDLQALIRVHASKLNPSDLLNAAGGFPYTTYPRVPGRDYAGVVVKAPGRPELEGTDVFGTSGNALGFTLDGAHAEYILVPISAVTKMPETLTHAQGGCVGVVYTTALLMIKRAQMDLGQMQNGSILIIGERGNVGTAVRDLLHLQCPNIQPTAANRSNGEIALPQAAKFDVIYSTVPDTATLQSALGMLNKHGKLVFIATTRPKTIKLEIDPLQFYRDDLSLFGVNSLNSSIDESKILMDELSGMFDSGKLRMPVEKEPQALRFTEARNAYDLKRNAVLLMA